MDYLDVQAIEEARQEKLDRAQAVFDVAKEADREPSPDELKTFDAFMAEHNELVEHKKRAEQHAAALGDLHASTRKKVPDPSLESEIIGTVQLPRTKPKPHDYSPYNLFAYTGSDGAQQAYDGGMYLLATLPEVRNQDPSITERALQHCKDRGLIRADGQTLDDDTQGGYLSPNTLVRAVLRIVDEVGVCRKVTQRIGMPTETMDQPKRTGGLTVYYPAELAAITTSQMTWGNVALVAKDRATLTQVSRKAMRPGSTIASIADQVATEIGYAFADKLDDEFIDGDGTSTYGGVNGIENAIGSAGINTGTTTSEDTWAELDLANFTDTMAKLPAKYWRRTPVWLMSPAFYFAVCVKLMAAAGGNVITGIESGANTQVIGASGANASFMGYPVFFTSKLPTATAVSTVQCFFGNFYDGVMLGDRATTEIAQSEHRYFAENAIGIRGLISYDLRVHEGGDASNAGSYVCFKTGAAS